MNPTYTITKNKKYQNRGKWLIDAHTSAGDDKYFRGVASILKPHCVYTSRSATVINKKKNKRMAE